MVSRNCHSGSIPDTARHWKLYTESYPHFLHVMAILFALNVCIMLLIGKMYPKETAYLQKDVEAVDMTPWALAKPVGAVVFMIVVSTYFVFT